MLLTKKQFAKVAGVGPSAIPKAVDRGMVVATPDGRIDPDALENIAYVEARYDQRVTAQREREYRRTLSGNQSEISQEAVSELEPEEPAYFQWYVRRLLASAFAEAEGAAAYVIAYGDTAPALVHDLVSMARRAKTPKAAEQAIRVRLEKLVKEIDPLLDEARAIFATFADDDTSRLEHELSVILIGEEWSTTQSEIENPAQPEGVRK